MDSSPSQNSVQLQTGARAIPFMVSSDAVVRPRSGRRHETVREAARHPASPYPSLGFHAIIMVLTREPVNGSVPRQSRSGQRPRGPALKGGHIHEHADQAPDFKCDCLGLDPRRPAVGALRAHGPTGRRPPGGRHRVGPVLPGGSGFGEDGSEGGKCAVGAFAVHRHAAPIRGPLAVHRLDALGDAQGRDAACML